MDGSTAVSRALDRTISRRRFIVAGLSAAGGLAIGVAIPGLAKALPLSAEPWSKEVPPPAGEINA
jgi:isoquinoline 1-oxidoreductase beta subunit